MSASDIGESPKRVNGVAEIPPLLTATTRGYIKKLPCRCSYEAPDWAHYHTMPLTDKATTVNPTSPHLLFNPFCPQLS